MAQRHTTKGDTHVYITQENGIRKVVISTGADVTTLGEEETFTGLARGGTVLYACTQAGIYSVNFTTGVLTKVVNIENLQSLDYISDTSALCTSLNSLMQISTAADTATGTSTLTETTVTGVTVTNDGYYLEAPTVLFTGGAGTGATGTPVLTAGKVTSVTIDDAGTGYTSAPTATFSAGVAGEILYKKQNL